MKPSAVLINTSPGPIVDQDALVAALTAGTIAGAGLDVYDVEPLPADNPLRTAPDTVLLPHLGYVTERAYRIMYEQAVEDMTAWRAGEPVRVLSTPPARTPDRGKRSGDQIGVDSRFAPSARTVCGLIAALP